ncbi:MAG: AAA family ATPase [Phototrophicaceae bacterium]
MSPHHITHLTIEGFQSIRRLDQFELGSINVLIGANGVGKSNFVNYFRMLGELVEERLQVWTRERGGSDRLLTYGIKQTPRLTSTITFGKNAYSFQLKPTVDGAFVFEDERVFFYGDFTTDRPLGSGHTEARLKGTALQQRGSIERYCYESISNWRVFHFHDTSDTAAVKRMGKLHDNKRLRSDASNLAAYLYHLREHFPQSYELIRKTVRLAIPFFDDFILDPEEIRPDEYQIQLRWRQKDSDYDLLPSQLSDGSLRFMCLATALLQPNPPSTLILDEPELGLHPYAIGLLGALVRSASEHTQIILSTQSLSLLSEVHLKQMIVVELEEGVSVFKRLKLHEFENWLEYYVNG